MKTERQPIELLSPARDLECGLAAINHGADAVYIGASQFGARAAAGNSIQDIETLVKYAHQFRSRIYVTLNTVLTDAQLPQAEKIIRQVYEAGADALIVQDMGILKLDLPPIALHASTQTDNRTVEKVQFLQEAGFSRVVLARELSLQQISDISAQTNVELEAFVHGALCVSYSGQCYMSQAMSGRSANRGQCAQYCRLPYDLQDADGQMLVRNKHLLSLKDLDLSASLAEMMEAGVMSFKIEGRLKDAGYVKNITAFYRKKLDAVLEENSSYRRLSSGKTTFFFEPDPAKSFRRNSSNYFLHGRHHDLIQPETPKSMGEPVGRISEIGKNFFGIQEIHPTLNNGDGLCFINSQGELEGFRLNVVKEEKAGIKYFPNEMPVLTVGTLLFRNQDQVFEKILNGKTSDRRVQVDALLGETKTGFLLKMTSEEGVSVTSEFPFEKQPAQKPDAVSENIKNQLSRLGNTIYELRQTKIQLNSPWFLPASTLADWRRQTIERLDAERERTFERLPAKTPSPVLFPQKTLTYLGNVTNRLAEDFYHEHGVQTVLPGFEVKAEEGVPLMYTKFCIKYEMGWCPKEGKKTEAKEPLFLRHKNQLFRLDFDCKACEMRISKG